MYSNFASIYDRLMQDMPYAGWINYLKRLFARHNIKPHRILDLGCGTGNVTIPLAEMGYRLTGLDLSPEMLAVAEEKARSKGLIVNWLCQDMRAMDMADLSFELVISMTDSLNYISTGDELLHVFKQVRNLLKDGGWFIFDLNSVYKLKEVFSDNVFTLLDDDIAYVWENNYDETCRTCYMDLTFFVKEADGRYRRFSEEHSETGYEINDIRELLNQAGLILQAVYEEETITAPQDTTERIYFVVRKE
ncbi:MAG: class I SAM-dependent methyltransferase [Thermincola sp.]|nr:class I SAM-dependent methyltransferase [Thermincola sp.]MDT3704338.1 class I SAM-dependent methyltransferase [Thermincola sp.]